MEHFSTMSNRSTNISARMDIDLWDQIDRYKIRHNCRDFSEALRALIKNGLWIEEHKNEITDPEKASKLISEWTAKMNEKDILDWPKELTDNQIQAAKGALQMEEDNRN